MDIDSMTALFEDYSESDFLKFDRVANKLSQRPDMHAFILLDQLVPGSSDIISAAEHDEFFIAVAPEKLAAVVTEEQVRDLVRCGLRYSEEFECFAMFA